MAERRPNFVFIMSDDHAAHAISAYGSRINTTPNIDRIAEGGMRLDSMFCTNSICTPSRAAIHTGKMGHAKILVTWIRAPNQGSRRSMWAASWRRTQAKASGGELFNKPSGTTIRGAKEPRHHRTDLRVPKQGVSADRIVDPLGPSKPPVRRPPVR